MFQALPIISNLKSKGFIILGAIIVIAAVVAHVHFLNENIKRANKELLEKQEVITNLNRDIRDLKAAIEQKDKAIETLTATSQINLRSLDNLNTEIVAINDRLKAAVDSSRKLDRDIQARLADARKARQGSKNQEGLIELRTLPKMEYLNDGFDTVVEVDEETYGIILRVTEYADFMLYKAVTGATIDKNDKLIEHYCTEFPKTDYCQERKKR